MPGIYAHNRASLGRPVVEILIHPREIYPYSSEGHLDVNVAGLAAKADGVYSSLGIVCHEVYDS